MSFFSIKKIRDTWDAGKSAQLHAEVEQQKFLEFIAVAKQIADQDKTQLQTLINLIARKPQAELLTQFVVEKRGGFFKRAEPQHILFSPFADIDGKGTTPHSIWTEKEITNSGMLLTDYILLPWPWSIERVINCFRWIGTDDNPWKFDEINHSIELYAPFNIGFVYGGNHSLTTGIVKGQGIIEKYKLVDISNVYNYVYCDGNYYRKKCDDAIIEQVQDKYIAAIFEIGRLMI